MAHGGKREGSGRKSGVPNLLTHELREKINATPLIKFLQDLAGGKIEGATINERKDAALGLLRKVLPDCRQTDIAVDNKPLIVVFDKEDANI